MSADAPGRLPYPALLLITDSARLHDALNADDATDGMIRIVREAVLGGVNVVQLREKQMPHQQLLKVGRDVRDAIASRALLFVNGDIEAAIILGADGVHLPEIGGSVAEARARVSDGMLISRAVHGIDATRAAERDGADLVQLGTAFATASKPGVEQLGIEGVREVCAAVRVPVIAVGGITAANAASVLGAGAAGVAVIGAIFDARSPQSAAEELSAAVGIPPHTTAAP